ncbi:MAG TPA: cupin domain-containing protein [Terracidiphilus sp.]|nr:cupin domain-containing protein [Terracidiphilus sp.]
MAVLRFPETDQKFENESAIRDELAALGIDYERWSLDRVGADASAEDVLKAYADEIEEMKRKGGYVTADVIDVNPETPNLDAMLAKFDKEHTHSEDEVRFVLGGRGIFFLNIKGKVASVEVGPGDMLRVPKGTMHWFTLCEDRRIRAIRWFQQTAGWTPNFTDSGVDKNYQPLCFGPTYMGRRVETGIRV